MYAPHFNCRASYSGRTGRTKHKAHAEVDGGSGASPHAVAARGWHEARRVNGGETRIPHRLLSTARPAGNRLRGFVILYAWSFAIMKTALVHRVLPERGCVI